MQTFSTATQKWDPLFLTKFRFVGSHLKKHLLITGRTKLIRMIQLLAQWKDLLLYLSNDHFVLPNGSELQKVDGGEWGVPVPTICLAKKLFSRQGTCVPLETSATHRSKE